MRSGRPDERAIVDLPWFRAMILRPLRSDPPAPFRPAVTVPAPHAAHSPSNLLDFAMLIALAALSIAAPQEHASLHPATSAIVAEVPDVQALFAAYPKTAAARMLADPELHDSIGQMMAGEGAAPVDPLEMLLAQYDDGVASGQLPPLLEMGSGIKAISMSVDVPGGDMFGFIEAADGLDSTNYVVENMGLRIVVDFVDAESCARATGLFSEMLSDEAPRNNELQPLAMTLENGGAWGADAITVWTYEPTDEEQYEWTAMERSTKLMSGGTRMAMALGNVEAAEFVEILASGQQDESAAKLFAAGREAIGGPKGMTVMEVHMTPFVERLLMQEAPEFVPMLDLAEGLMGSTASAAIRGGHWRFDIDEDGSFLLEGVHPPSAAGPMAGLLGGKPLTAGALSLAHPDALVTTVTSLDKDVLVNMISGIAADQGPEALAQLDQVFGFRPDRDLAAPLGSAVAYSLPKLGSLVAAPNLMIAMELDDKDAFLRGMDGLFKMITATTDEVQVARDEYKKISTLYTMSLPGMFGDLGGGALPVNPAELIKPTIAVLGDRVVITTNKSHAKKEVRRVRKLLEAGPDAAPSIHEGITGLGDLAGAATVSYADWAGFVGGVYSQLKAFGPMLAGAGLPMDVAALPSAEVLTRHFQPSERRVRIKDGMVHHSTRSSFGPEVNGLPALLSAGLFSMTARIPDEQVVIASAEAPSDFETGHVHEIEFDAAEEGTMDALVQVSVALTLYQLDHDDVVPQTLEELTKPAPNYPKGYLEGAVPKDTWGNALLYKPDGKTFSLYSTGANGVDEGGEGDDMIGG